MRASSPVAGPGLLERHLWHLADLSGHLWGDGQAALRQARQEAAEALAQRDKAAGELLGAQRQRRLASASLAEAAAALRAAESERAARQRDCQGLQRTLKRLEELAEAVDREAEVARGAVAEAEQAAGVLEVEERSLENGMASLGDAGDTLERRVALERDKRLKLQEAARAKLERVDRAQADLQQRAAKHRAEVEARIAVLSKQQSATAAALAEVARYQDEVAQASAEAKQRRGDKKALQAELMGLRQEQARMREELARIDADLTARTRRREEAQRAWRMQHMEGLDARVRARQARDRDVIVAVEGA